MSSVGAKFPVSHSQPDHVARSAEFPRSRSLLLWLTHAICISTFLFRKRLEPAVLACFSRGTNIANWDAAVYCAWVVRDSLVVGEIKRWLRNDAGSIDLGADTALLVRP
jgi:hypothetical protein